MATCVACGKPLVEGAAKPATGQQTGLHFSSRSGGILCQACSGRSTDKYPIQRGTLAGLDALASARAGKRVSLSDGEANSVNRLLLYHISQQLGKVPRMAKHVITVAKAKV